MKLETTQTLILQPDEQFEALGYEVICNWGEIKTSNPDHEQPVMEDVEFSKIESDLIEFAVKRFDKSWASAELRIVPQSAAPEFHRYVSTLLKLEISSSVEQSL